MIDHSRVSELQKKNLYLVPTSVGVEKLFLSIRSPSESAEPLRERAGQRKELRRQSSDDGTLERYFHFKVSKNSNTVLVSSKRTNYLGGSCSDSTVYENGETLHILTSLQ